jgi:general secretion pathway protein G
MELEGSLRLIRQAIDGFYRDYKDGKISKLCDCAGDSGYPKSLQVLVDGASEPGIAQKKRKYLRRIPADPFADQTLPAAEQWGLRSYADEPDSRSWSGDDVYDVYTKSERKAINGSKYADW